MEFLRELRLILELATAHPKLMVFFCLCGSTALWMSG